MNLSIKFTKMHGLGNDFVFVSKKDIDEIDNIPKMVLSISNRHTGIGCDQFIIYENKLPHISLEIYNEDGSSAEACGNATRCIAYLFSEKTGEKDVEISVAGRILDCRAENINNVSVNMGQAKFTTNWMPSDTILANELRPYLSSSAEFLCVDIGNPHLVIIDQNISIEDMVILGPRFEKSHLFPSGVNVNFISIEDNKINLKVWERGVGFTYACGSGACASFAASSKLGFIPSKAKVQFELGDLEMEYKEADIVMSGPVALVAEGTFYYEK